MAEVVAQPLIHGTLLATKVTLRFPLSLFERRGAKVKDAGAGDCPSEGSSSASPKGRSPKASKSTSRKSSRSAPSRSKIADGEDSACAEASVAPYAEVKILVNCGWSLEFESGSVDLLKRHAADVDIIAISDGDFHHVGALPVVYAWLSSQRGESGSPPILCTEGSYKFARACLVDVLENATFSYKFDAYSISSLDRLYDACLKLRYRESFQFSKSFGDFCVHVAMLPVNNGCSIGGALWKIFAGTRTVICGPNYRVQPAWYLNGCDLAALRRVDVFLSHEQHVASDSRVFPQAAECRGMREILSAVAGTLRSHGSVLIPVDVGSCVIDLLLHLNAVWANSDLQPFPIVLVSPIASKLVLLFATCLEYLRVGICRSFLRTMWNPIFNMKFIHPVSTLEGLRKFATMPCVFVSTCSSLSFGVTSYLFAALCSYERNSVIFTECSPTVRTLLMQVHRARCASRSAPVHHEFTLRLNLEPEETVEPPAVEEPVAEVTEEKVASSEPLGKASEEGVGGDYLYNPSEYFMTVNGCSTYVPPRIVRDDFENRAKRTDESLDYGLPYDSFSRADLDQTLDPLSMVGMSVDEPPRDRDPAAVAAVVNKPASKNPFDDYQRQYLDEMCVDDSAFDDTVLLGEPSADEPKDPSKPRLVTKSLPLVIKCNFYVTRHFRQLAPSSELLSLLRETAPRHTAILPHSQDVSRLRNIELSVRSTLRGCGECHSYSDAISPARSTRSRSQGICDYAMRVPLDMRLEVVNMTVPLTAGLTHIFLATQAACPASSIAISRAPRTPRLERLMSVFASIDKWKFRHNRQYIYQVAAKVGLTDLPESSEAPVELRSIYFWSQPPVNLPRLSLSSTAEDSADLSGSTSVASGDVSSSPTSSEVKAKVKPTRGTFELKRSGSHSVYAGPVGLSTLVRFVDECLPECTNLGGGVMTVNESVHVSACASRYGVQRWSLRGTLDPAFYLSRKMLRKLHNRVEPLY